MSSSSIDKARGERTKIVFVDEALEVDQDRVEACLEPTKNFTRENARKYGFPDYPSKSITVTSACEQSNSFYNRFRKTLAQFAKGVPGYYAWAMDYHAAVDGGITPASYFEGERLRQPAPIFAMEYESIFLGAGKDAALPYELVEKCRTLTRVETEQPKKCQSKYVFALDIATSTAKDADNSIIAGIKYSERADGTFSKKLVYLRSFHGKGLDVLAQELRVLYHKKFSNTVKLIYDARGLGDSLDRFFSDVYVDPDTGVEYPALIVDDAPQNNAAVGVPALHPFRAVQTLNQRIYTNMRVSLEKKSVEIPVHLRVVEAAQAAITDIDKRMKTPEKEIYREADALQIEMGNIIAKTGASGSVLYDTPNPRIHKDRYSAFAMALDYVCELEKENVKRRSRGSRFIGFATDI